MARAVLVLAFTTAAFGFLQLKIWEAIGRQPIPFVDLAFMLPAVLLGGVYWWKGQSYASRWPVVLCILLVWLSLFYPGNTERMRGLYIGVLLTIPLPLAALVVEKRAWLFCAKVYVWANTAAVLMAFWFESRSESSLGVALGRFGFLVSDNGVDHTGNPNQVGGQLGFAAVLAFILYLKDGEESKDKDRTSRFPNVYLLVMIVLSITVMLTASRGAFAAWFPAVALLFALGTGGIAMSRLKDLVALSIAGVLVVMILSTAGQSTPWDQLNKRFGNRRTSGSLSGRSEIWVDALEAWQSHPDYIWRGTGIGMADDVLGRFSNYAKDDGEGGLLRKNCHNGFVEWMLSFGLVGIAAGVCLAGSMLYQALRLDMRDRNVARIALLSCSAIFALTSVSYRHECWTASSALALAMLTEPVWRRHKTDGKQVGEGASRPALAGSHFVAGKKVEPGEVRLLHTAHVRSEHASRSTGATMGSDKA